MKKQIFFIFFMATAYLAGGQAVTYMPIPFDYNFTVTPMQPNIPHSGRLNCIAQHPTRNDEIIVTSETGGIFKTTNNGAYWYHIDGFRNFYTNEVAYYPADPSIVLVSASKDYTAGEGGGIWYSEDNGSSWEQSKITGFANANLQISGYGISFCPDGRILVATTNGLATSTDKGKIFSIQAIEGIGRVFGVLAIDNSRVIISGEGGVFYSTDGGNSWSKEKTGIGMGSSFHPFAICPEMGLTSKVSVFKTGLKIIRPVFVVTGADALFYSDDGGVSWKPINAPKGSGDAGGIPFIKIRKRPGGMNINNGVELFFGNALKLYKLVCSPVNILRPYEFNYGGNWQTLSIDHNDTRDLSFQFVGGKETNIPKMLASDGGLHTTIDGIHFKLEGGGNKGLNALQIAQVDGQLIQDSKRNDMYFLTQDNNVWWSSNNGYKWNNGYCCEGFYMQQERKVPTESDSKIVLTTCGVCYNWLISPQFKTMSIWKGPKNGDNTHPVIISNGNYIQQVGRTKNSDNNISITSDFGNTWKLYSTVPSDFFGLPVISKSQNETFAYFGYQGGYSYQIHDIKSRISRLKITSSSQPGLLSYPANNGLGSVGVCPTMWAWYEVFAVNPVNPKELIAADVENKKMKISHDGAETWENLDELTDMVTGNGRFDFNYNNSPFERASFVSHISYCPDNPVRILIATMQNGLFFSGDGGKSWKKIDGSDKISYGVSSYWKSENDIVIASYGRGLWKVDIKTRSILDDIIISGNSGTPDASEIYHFKYKDVTVKKYNNALILFNGYITGIKMESGKLLSYNITPGTSRYWMINDLAIEFSNADIPFNETENTGDFSGADELRNIMARGYKIRGITFENNEVCDFIFGKTEYQSAWNLPAERTDFTINPDFPFSAIPFAIISSENSFAGHNMLTPGERFNLSGKNFQSGIILHIYIDNSKYGEVNTDASGTFSVFLNPPNLYNGIHGLTIKSNIPGSAEWKTLYSMTLSVVSTDHK